MSDEEIISANSSELLRDYLIHHESDIAHGINDFDKLERLFIEIYKRAPSKDATT